MMRVLVTTDGFRVGGRETFLSCVVNALRARDWSASLLADQVTCGTPEIASFERVWPQVRKHGETSLRDWLECGAAVMDAWRPDLVWAQHFDVLPAWVLSRIYGIPLLTTFHGPLIGAGRPNGPMQALGMTLGLHRGDGVSGVSNEILQGIRSLIPSLHAELTPNAVVVPDAPPGAASSTRPERFVVVSRPDKLGHLRQAALLFNEFRLAAGMGRLTIAAGATPMDRVSQSRRLFGAYQRIIRVVTVLGARWCMQQGRSFIRGLHRMNLIGYTDDAPRLIGQSDVVFGMGRVVLEGLAQRKPTVLIGYDAICGPVSSADLDRFRESNFSGRGCPKVSARETAAAVLRGEWGISEDELATFNMDSLAPNLDTLFRGVANGRVELREDGIALRRLANLSAPEIFSQLAGELSYSEFQTFFRLCEG